MKILMTLVCACISMNVYGAKLNDAQQELFGITIPHGAEVTIRIIRASDPCAPPANRFMATRESEHFAATLALALAETYEIMADDARLRADTYLTNDLMSANATKEQQETASIMITRDVTRRLAYLRSAYGYAQFAHHAGFCAGDDMLYWHAHAVMERTILGKVMIETATNE